jgi:hypothetical protein
MEEKGQNATFGAIPQQTERNFEVDQVIFTSHFDSGNMGRVERAAPDVYYIWTAPDCANTEAEVTCRSWFYFQVTAPVGKTLTLTIKNLNLQGKLFREGMKPVVQSAPDSNWVRMSCPVTYTTSLDTPSLFEVSFRHHFLTTSAYFAFTFPFSYSDNQALLTSLPTLAGEDVYLHRENMISSLEGRRCDMVTISSYDDIMETRETHTFPLFPDNQRPLMFAESKKIVFVTGRVHPGETPGSHMLNGFLKWVISQDPRAIEARKHFVFKVIPILNPDGVYRGYYRTDTTGVNLNRYYQSPDVKTAPTIWATREVVLSFASRLYLYVDLHGHASKRAIFLYGNYMDFPKQVESMTFAKLMSINCANFDFEGSNFTERNMKTKDKRDGLSKEGSSRVALFRATNLTLCFTMEANYHSGSHVNTLPDSGLEESKAGQSSADIYENGPPAYTVEVLEEAGKALGVSMLDSIGKNLFSRVRNSEYGNLDGVKVAAAEYVSTMAPFRFNSDIRKLVKNKEQLLLSFAPSIPKKKPERATKKLTERKCELPPAGRTTRPPRPKLETQHVSKPRASSETLPAVVNVKIKNFIMPAPVSPRSEARRVVSPAGKPPPAPRRAAHSQNRPGSRSRSSGSARRVRDTSRRELPLSPSTADGQAE